MLSAVLVVLLVLLVLAVDRWKPRRFVDLHRKLSTSVRHVPLLGHSWKFIASEEERMNFMLNLGSEARASKYGMISVWVVNIFGVVISDPKLAAAVLKSSHHRDFIHKFVKYLIGNGTLFASDEEWPRHRKILEPAFQPRIVKELVSVFDRKSKITVERLESVVRKGNFSCWDHISAFSLDSVCETTLGVDAEVSKDLEHPFIKAFYDSLRYIAIRGLQPWLHPDVVYNLTPESRRQGRRKEIMYEFIDKMLLESKRLKEEGNRSEDLRMFLETIETNSKSSDRPYSADELREEILMLVLAGTDTTATALCFILLMLSQHPDLQDRVYREILEVFGDSGRSVEYADLQQLKYLDAFVKETLRLYPAVPVTLTDIKKDIDLPNGLTLPKGCEVAIHMYAIHRDPHYWGEDAELFNPDRFLEGQLSSSQAYMPFSVGLRRCVGQQYAMLSMKTLLLRVLRRFRVAPATSFRCDQQTPLRLRFEIVMKHVDNFHIQLEHRS